MGRQRVRGVWPASCVSWLDLEARHAAAARQRRQVERLAAHLHIDAGRRGRRPPTAAACPSGRRSRRPFTVRRSSCLPPASVTVIQDSARATKTMQVGCRRPRLAPAAAGGARAPPAAGGAARRWLAQPAAPARPPCRRAPPATAPAAGGLPPSSPRAVQRETDGADLIEDRLRQPEQHGRARPAAAPPRVSRAREGSPLDATAGARRRGAQALAHGAVGLRQAGGLRARQLGQHRRRIDAQARGRRWRPARARTPDRARRRCRRPRAPRASASAP